ncbi:unnamed protein product, partial [Pylaiella littoralis]
DDENGWQLRVAPERDPAEERGDWTRYTAAGGGAGDGSAYPDGGEDLYYNTVTGEYSYEVPAEWNWLETQPLGTSFFDLESSGDSANYSTLDWSNDTSQITGDSTYYGEPLLALQGDGAAESAEGQSYGGVMVEGYRAEYASCGDWTKYYDAEYACDYYHNYRRTQYDRPDGFQTPR